MAHDRYRHDQDRYRDRYSDEREEDGYIARRGFGNRSAGYDRGSREDDRYGRGRERDFGDSAGYGSGGSTRDWREVVGDDRERDRPVFGAGSRRDADWGYPRSGPRYEQDDDRHGSGFFGRGSRDYAEGYGSRDRNEDRGFFERAGDEIRSWFGDEEPGRRDRDLQSSQHHRGRGPKGYTRSDERILEDVNDRLTDDPHLDASEIDVSVSNREVTLSGTVNSRFEKRHAEDLAESISGVTHVQNNLRIQQYADAGIAGSMLSGAGAAGAGSTSTPETGAASDTAGAGVKRRRPGTTSDT